MIQRIQTVFLLLAAAAAFCLFAFPFASTAQAVSASDMFADGFYDISDNIALQILFSLAGVLAFVSVLLFKLKCSFGVKFFNLIFGYTIIIRNSLTCIIT